MQVLIRLQVFHVQECSSSSSLALLIHCSSEGAKVSLARLSHLGTFLHFLSATVLLFPTSLSYSKNGVANT